MKTIRELRQERAWSQFQLATRVGVHPQAVYLWESGRRMPLVPQVRKLGQVFGLCSDEIVLVDPPSNLQRATRRSNQDHRSADGRDEGDRPVGDDDAAAI